MKDAENVAVEGAKVTAKAIGSGNEPVYAGSGGVLVKEVTEHSSALGLVTLTLLANSTLTPSNSYYRISIQPPSERKPRVAYIVVPNGAGPYDVEDVLHEPGTVDESALAAHVATIKTHGDWSDSAPSAGQVPIWDGTNWTPGDTVATDIEAAALVTAHSADTTAIHGIADTSLLETQAGAQTKATAAQTAAISAAATDSTTKADAAQTAAEATAAADATAKVDAAKTVRNVRDFGAVGDGVTNDTAAFQAALALGGNIFVPASSDFYMVNELSVTEDHTRLFGEGYGSALKLNPGLGGNAQLLNINKGGAKYRVGVTVESLRLDGNGALYDGDDENEVIAAANTQDLTIRECHVENAASDGIDLDGHNPGVKVLFNRIRNNGRHGLHSYGPDDGIFLGNTFEGNAQTWYLASGQARSAAIDVNDEQQGGASVSNPRNVLIAGNTFRGDGQGIIVRGAESALIADNAFYDIDGASLGDLTYGHAIEIGASTESSTVTGNYIESVYAYGITGRLHLVSGNTIKSATRGIYPSGGLPVVSDNVVDACGTGILIGISSTIKNNRISSPTGRGIETNDIAGTADSVIEGNTISSPTGIGIYVVRKARIVGNVVSAGADLGIQVTGSNTAGCEVSGNRVYDCAGDGIEVKTTSGHSIKNNYVSGVTTTNEAGLRLNAVTDSSCVGNHITGCYFGLVVAASTADSLVSNNRMHDNTSSDFIISGSVGTGNEIRDNHYTTGSAEPDDPHITSDDHDDRYYTETEMDVLLGRKQGARTEAVGEYFSPAGAATVASPTLSQARYVPLSISKDQTFDRIAVEITTGVASSVVRLGIYASAADGRPGALILDAGTVDASTNGVKEITISQALDAGDYWLVAVNQVAAAAMRVINGWLPGVGASTLGTNSSCYIEAGVTGALPATATPLSGTTQGPHLALRAS